MEAEEGGREKQSSPPVGGHSPIRWRGGRPMGRRRRAADLEARRQSAAGACGDRGGASSRAGLGRARRFQPALRPVSGAEAEPSRERHRLAPGLDASGHALGTPRSPCPRRRFPPLPRARSAARWSDPCAAPSPGGLAEAAADPTSRRSRNRGLWLCARERAFPRSLWRRPSGPRLWGRGCGRCASCAGREVPGLTPGGSSKGAECRSGTGVVQATLEGERRATPRPA